MARFPGAVRIELTRPFVEVYRVTIVPTLRDYVLNRSDQSTETNEHRKMLHHASGTVQLPFEVNRRHDAHYDSHQLGNQGSVAEEWNSDGGFAKDEPVLVQKGSKCKPPLNPNQNAQPWQDPRSTEAETLRHLTRYSTVYLNNLTVYRW